MFRESDYGISGSASRDCSGGSARGLGFSDAPDHKSFEYSFDHLAEVMGRFTEEVGLKKFAVYVFDYGAPTGFRMALKHPERITALISQNGNAYVEGLSDGWAPVRKYWANPTPENRNALKFLSTPEALPVGNAAAGGQGRRFANCAPEAIALDQALLDRPQSSGNPARSHHRSTMTNIELYPEISGIFPHASSPYTRGMGKRHDPFFCPAWGRKRFVGTIPPRRWYSLTRDISPWKPMQRKLGPKIQGPF